MSTSGERPVAIGSVTLTTRGHHAPREVSGAAHFTAPKIRSLLQPCLSKVKREAARGTGVITGSMGGSISGSTLSPLGLVSLLRHSIDLGPFLVQIVRIGEP
jgi:hypothetical protein